MEKRNISLTLEEAKKLYNDLPPVARPLLEGTFPELKPDICSRVYNVETACRELGINYGEFISCLRDSAEEGSEQCIKLFAKALREGKSPRGCDYYPYFSGSGSGFSYYDYGNVSTHLAVGASLRVDTAKKAEHLGRCMLVYYKMYLGRS